MNYELVSVFDSLLGAHKPFPQGEYYYSCPFCSHHNPKLAVNLIKKKWHCWTCNQSGKTLMSLLKKLSVSREQIQRVASMLEEELPRYQQEPQEEIVLKLPPEYIPLYETQTSLSYRRALQYVTNRNLTMDDIIRYQIGYCMEGRYADRIIFPSYDDRGILNFFVGRTMNQKSLNYLTPPVHKNFVGFDSHINWNYPIIIAEGAFDAAAIKRNAIPLFGKNMSTALRKKIVDKNVRNIYLALDNDALSTTIRMADKFMRDDRNVFVVPMHGKDPSLIGFTEMHNRIRNIEPLNFRMLTQLKLQLT